MKKFKYVAREGSPGHYRYFYADDPKTQKLKKIHMLTLKDPLYYQKKNWTDNNTSRLNRNILNNISDFNNPFTKGKLLKSAGFTRTGNSYKDTKESNQIMSDIKSITTAQAKKANETFKKVRKLVDLNKDYKLNKITDKILSIGESFLSKYLTAKSVDTYTKIRKNLTHGPNSSLGDVGRKIKLKAPMDYYRYQKEKTQKKGK